MLKPSSLVRHLAREHHRGPLGSYLKEIVYGGNDGIVTTFAIVSGFSGASLNVNDITTLSFFTVLLFGFANLFADAISMGLGNYLASKSEKDLYKKDKEKEFKEILDNTKSETVETLDILQAQGFSKEDSATLTNIYEKNPKYWTNWMMNYELETPNPEKTNLLLTSLSTFLAFIIFGLIPLLPYIFFQGNVLQAFVTAVAATIGALSLLGILKWVVTGGKLIRAVGEFVLIGGIASLVAFLVGTFFKGI